MKNTYIEMMEQCLSAYSDEHILRYYNEVREQGLTEHGFPRLTANIGIMIAHGRRRDLLPMFYRMMDLCCAMFLRPYVKAANEFSVREIVCCLWELEGSGAVEPCRLEEWKAQLSRIVPEECYNVLVTGEEDKKTNWAIFGAVSEYARNLLCGVDTSEFIDRQLSCQFQWLDENGMYRDEKHEIPHQPIVYDLVSRGLFALLLHFGYRGKYYGRIDACLRQAGLLSLKMQSPDGEIPFGGRSNQFLHNEAWLVAVLEYEAARYAREGKPELAKSFKAATARALSVTEEWLAKKPVSHIKNRFPVETLFGCEGYGYFDKYMITTASNLHAAYLMCDDSIPARKEADREPCAFLTSSYFHKLFLKSGGYGLEVELDGDPHYDASGLGRVHRAGAPLAICLSLPCPAHPNYTLTREELCDLSLCPGVREGGEWRFATDRSVLYEVIEKGTDERSAYATLRCSFAKRSVDVDHTVSEEGVEILVRGEGELAYMLPAFEFDGESETEILAEDQSLTVSYGGWRCRYTTDGTLFDTKKKGANRNGYYRAYAAKGTDRISVKIQIFPA